MSRRPRSGNTRLLGAVDETHVNSESDSRRVRGLNTVGVAPRRVRVLRKLA